MRRQTPLPTLDGIVRCIAEVNEVPPNAISPQNRLVADLGLDSLALAELVVVLQQTYGTTLVAEDQWADITAEQLLARLTATPAAAE